MKIGCCTGIENIEKVKALGINEIELWACLIADMSDEEFQDLKDTISKSGVKTSVFSVLMHWDLKPLFRDENFEDASAYLNRLMPRLKELGGEYVIFGSGNYRRAPEETDISTVKEKISEFLKLLCGIAGKFNITVLVEPLNKNETNVLLNTSEVMEYIKALNIENLTLLVDLYHFDLEGEDFSNIINFKDYIRHIHIAQPKGRNYPKAGDGYDYSGFLGALKEIDYNGIISIEVFTDFNEGDIALSKELIEIYFR